jgi:GTP-binding protein
VGKSSLLNALLGRRIAKTSGTPGKTRALNVYVAEVSADAPGRARSAGSEPRPRGPAPQTVYLLDLPGYGYARVSKHDRDAFARLVRHVLARPRLAGAVWLLDVRRDPSAEDRAMLDRLAQSRTAVLAAVTKADKVPRGRRATRVRAIRDDLALDAEQVVTTSARTGDGIQELAEAIQAFVAAVPS